MRKFPLLVFVALACIGCASFSGRDLPQRRPLEELPRMPAISYELRTFGTPFSGIPGPIESRVEPLFRRAFAEVTLGAGEGGDELHLDLFLRMTSRHPALSIGLGCLFVGSLGLFPAYAEDELYLDVRVQRDGRTLEQYLYTERLKSWYHLFLLPWSFASDPSDVGGRILDDMVRRFLEDLRRDLPKLAGDE